MGRYRLEMELTPESAWGKSLAQLLPKEYWDKIRRLTYQVNWWTCQVCGASGVQVHCHEVWKYDTKKRLKILVALMCLCRDCHDVKHWGRTVKEYLDKKITQERKDYLVEHFCTVNHCTQEDMLNHIVEMGDLNQRRSRFGYKLDLSSLKGILNAFEEIIITRKKEQGLVPSNSKS